MKTEKLRLSVSMILALIMIISGMSIYFPSFAEEEGEPESEEITGQTEEETADPEPEKHTVTLPFSDVFRYEYQEDHLKEKNDNGDVILLYEPGEKVKLYLTTAEDEQIRAVSVLDGGRETACVWNIETGKVVFEMPAEDVRLAAETEVIEQQTEEVIQESAAETDPPDPEEKTETEGAPEIETGAAAVSETTPDTQAGFETEAVMETEPETDPDGLPMQGSVVTVEAIKLPFDTWEFDPENDLTNIPYDPEQYMISYVSDDIIYDVPGLYSSIYRVTDPATGKFWFALRPVIISEEGEEAWTEPEPSPETETDPSEGDADDPEKPGEAEDQPEETTEEQVLTEEEEPRLAALQIRKEDTDGNPLVGVTFQIRDTEAEEDDDSALITGTYETGEDGRIIRDGLPAGIYEITEISTLPGYIPDETPRYAAVSADGLISESDAKGKAVSGEAEAAATLTLTWINDYTKWEFHKTDMAGEKELAGASLQVLDAGGTVVEEWISEEEPHRINKLAPGEYTLAETTAPDGYVLASPIPFTVTQTGELQSLTMADKQFFIVKTDVRIDELAGAELEVRDENGRVVDSWTSDGTPHAVSNLEDGKTYILAEIKAPEGYAIASEIPFTVSNDAGDDTITLINKQVFVHKTDAAGQKELAGASLNISSLDGTIVDEWKSDDEPHPLSGIRVGETYILTEVRAPAGYAVAARIEFTVSDDGINQEIFMADEEIELTVSKKSTADGRELPGAALQIYDSERNLTEEWVSEEEPHRMNLAAGTYVLAEKSAPAGYAAAENMEFEVVEDQVKQQIVLYDIPVQAEISKKDITDDEELPGAHLMLKDPDGNLVDDWTSDDEPHVIMNLPVGTYTLMEVTAPEGYDVADAVSILIEDSPDLQQFTLYDSPKEGTADLTGKTSTVTNGGSTTISGSAGVPGGGSASGSGSGSGSVTASSVKTGDPFRYLGAALLILTGGVLLTGTVLKRKRRRNS